MKKKRKNSMIKNEYMNQKNIGEDLFFRNQIVLSLKNDKWIELNIRSNVFYELSLHGAELFKPCGH